MNKQHSRTRAAYVQLVDELIALSRSGYRVTMRFSDEQGIHNEVADVVRLSDVVRLLAEARETFNGETDPVQPDPTTEQDAVADALAEAVKYVEPSIRKAVAFDILTRQLQGILSRPHPFPYQIRRLFSDPPEQKDTVEDRVKRLEAIGEFYNDLTRDMGAAVRIVVDAISEPSDG